MTVDKTMTKDEFIEKWGASMGHGFTDEECLSDLNALLRAELIRYKIWENIFGDNYDTLEPMIDEYLKPQQ
jgi:hypothetical protein